MGMYSDATLNSLIDDHLDGKKRDRSAKTSATLSALLSAAEQKVTARQAFRAAYAAAADAMGKEGGSTRDKRNALRQYEGDHDGADDTDILLGSWLRRVSALSPALEPTVALVLDAVLYCNDPTDLKSALSHFEKAAKADRKVDAATGKRLIGDYPPLGGSADADRNETDFVELGKAREKRARS